MNTVEKTAKDIKSLKIQGATNVRKRAVEALLDSVVRSDETEPGLFRKEFLHNVDLLYNSRPTEPELRTALLIIKKSISVKHLTIHDMKQRIKLTIEEYEDNRTKSIEAITKIGSELIEEGSTIITICHSSTVINMLIKAKHKIKKVYCLESRPLYQGRMTARDLSKAGLDVTLLVDNAATTVLKECKYFFSGADAILADGDVVNKIGTNQISALCKKYDVKHYVVASSHKFEPATFFGAQEPIESRSTEEVWTKKEKEKFGAQKAKIINPAFDRTDAVTIEGIICELGIFPPAALATKLYQDLDLSKHEKDFLKMSIE